MFGTYFYNETIRRSVSIFGTLFNNIKVKKTKSDGTVLTEQLVPISYQNKSFYKDLQKNQIYQMVIEHKSVYLVWHSKSVVLNMTKQDNKIN